MINGNTEVLAHIGYPTYTFKSPLILNPYFDSIGVNAIVVPMGCQKPDYANFLRTIFKLTNIKGALITMPHKVATVDLVDEVSPTVRVAGACNAVRRTEDGRLIGEQFDGAGFVRGVQRKGFKLRGVRALVVGSGGVGSAIAASLASAGVANIGLYDMNSALADSLAHRLKEHFPSVGVTTGRSDPHGYDLVVNATPLGMKDDDPLPMDASRISPNTFVGEVVLKSDSTPFLDAARARGCQVLIGTDMLFEQMPAYLEFFGYPSTDAESLRSVAQLSY